MKKKNKVKKYCGAGVKWFHHLARSNYTLKG